MSDLLAQILSKQHPAKLERAREEVYARKASGLLVPRVHAEIVSLADYTKAA